LGKEISDDIDPRHVLRRYIIDVILILACLFASYIASNLAVNSAEQAGVTINKSGKQRMRSQRILYLNHLMNDFPTKETARHITATVNEFEKSHAELLKNQFMSPELYAIYYEPNSNQGLNTLVDDLISKSRKSVQEFDRSNTAYFGWASTFDGAGLLTGLDHAVTGFQNNAKIEFERFELIQTITFFMAIAILVFEAFFVFRPALQKVKASIERDRALVAVQNNFLTKMSHEMRTPLNAIIGFSEALLGKFYGTISDKQVERVTDINDSGKHLLSLVNDLLDLNRISRDELPINCENENLHDAIAYALTAIEAKATVKNIEIDYSQPKETMTVYIDSVRTRQCIINILDNAVKFSPNKSKISIRLNPTIDTINLAIEDNGPGMPKDQIAVALRMFGQIENKEYISSEGLGIGLSLTAMLMERQSGGLKVESTPNAGTTVTLSFAKTE
jgi:signal transduction histidine kinase